jgi:hypothetical protein
MNRSNPSHRAASKDISLQPTCRAELIFYAQNRTNQLEPEKILGVYACDFTRPDWQHRWTEWNSHINPYLNLFLCREHARKLGLKV